MAEWHPAFEEYCEAIFELDEDDIKVVQARIAERLSISRPSVSEMMKRLEGAALISLNGSVIQLTRDGRTLAERVVRRHRLAERFLTDILGLSWAEAHVEAGKWEHVISDSVEAAFARVLNDPTTCPHGNPIPGTAYLQPETTPLNEVGLGETFRVERIPEELEFAPGILDLLQELHLTPGATGRVISHGTDGTVRISVDGQVDGLAVTVDTFSSNRILVSAGNAAQ